MEFILLGCILRMVLLLKNWLRN